jgi:signal transduction histidine kinase
LVLSISSPVVTPPEFEDELLKAKLEALAEFAAGAGHEINNPLATILGRTDLLLRRIGRLAPSGETAEAARDLNIIAGQVQRIRDMIGDLMLFARPPAPKFEACDLGESVRTALKTFHSQASFQGVELKPELEPGIVIRADRVQLGVVLSELLRNSLNATATGGMINVATTAGDVRPVARITIEDNGSGLSETDQEHLFDPFYSGRQAGRGLGFGLCKCWRIIQVHAGVIEVVAREGGGVRAVVDWPMV